MFNIVVVYLEVPTIKDLLPSAACGKQVNAVLKGVTRRKRNINGERKRKLGENLDVLKKK